MAQKKTDLDRIGEAMDEFIRENAVTKMSEEVLVTVQPEGSDECVTEIGYRYHGHWVLRNGLKGEVKAWMRFPKPYKE